MAIRIKEGGTGQTTAPGARIALGLSDQEIIDIVLPAIPPPGGPYQPLDSDLTAIAALTTTSYGRAFLELANAGAARTYMGLGTMATETASNYLTTAAAASSYQPLDSDLTAIAALSTTTYGRSLLILADAAAARTALALGTMATETATDYLTTATAASTYLPLAGGTLTGLLTTNGQIAFPASQNASSDANTLDDYEEGTWTPVYQSSSGTYGAITYSAIRSGFYVKIGRQVIIQGMIQTDSFAVGTGSGTVFIGGLPFVSATGFTGGVLVGTMCVGFRGAFAASQAQPAGGTILQNATTITLHTLPLSTSSGAGLQAASLAVGAVANQNQIRFSATYFTA